MTTTAINLRGSYPHIVNLQVYRGDDFKWKMTFAVAVDENNVPTDTLDVSGWDITAQIRSYANAPTVLAQFDVDMNEAASAGIVRLVLTTASMAALPARELVWDVQRTSPDTKTFHTGTFTPGADITKVVP